MFGRTKSSCRAFVDSWHAAATKADSAAYFNALAEDAVFIGTDSFEVWNKQQFLDFAAPYFKKGKAWDFVKISRNLHFDGERRMIWFDEVLDTWMGPCRGSGWIAIEGNQLKIKQYVLSMTVPNDKIDEDASGHWSATTKKGASGCFPAWALHRVGYPCNLSNHRSRHIFSTLFW
ncbi:MAG: nuclear transport factor 2 family protein [Saprospiraceae bacterium]|nr:nuclear transport factor 2 family protein [Saprospiraceae bacterium]